jgi:hypothetical protein
VSDRLRITQPRYGPTAEQSARWLVCLPPPTTRMDPDSWPHDPAVAFARLRRVIRQLDGESEEESLILLSDLLCAAWGSLTAQNQ